MLESESTHSASKNLIVEVIKRPVPVCG